MLTRAQLERVAQTLTHDNVGHAETLYLQDILLSTVSRETADQLVFKGGTALLKFFQLDRFSADLDFTAHGPLDFGTFVSKAERDLENYGAIVEEHTDDETEATFTTRFAIQGPLYTGNRRSLNFIRLEVNKESTVRTAPTHRYTPPFTDIPSFDLTVLDETEILAEKVRALMTRRQPRDLYDIYHLLDKSVPFDLKLVQEKLDYYDIEYEPGDVIERAMALEGQWDTLETLTYLDNPPFSKAIEVLEQGLNRADSIK